MAKTAPNTGSEVSVETSDILLGIENMKNVARGDGSADRGSFMKFSKGSYSYGSDGIEPEDDSKWAVNPRSFMHGFHAWGDGKLLGSETAGMGAAPILKASLETHTFTNKKGDDEVARWAPYRGFELVCTSGDDSGMACIIGGTSQGMVKAINGLISDLANHLRENAATPVPIIELGSDSYKHNTYGKIFIPVFEIVEWVTMDAMTVGDIGENEDEDEEPEPAKPKRKRKAKAAKPAPEPEEKDEMELDADGFGEDEDYDADEADDEVFSEDAKPAKPARQRRRRNA